MMTLSLERLSGQ